MLKKERSRSPRKRMAGICPVMRGQAAGTDARAETARARGGRRKAQAQRYWGPVGQRARREVFFSFWYPVASMGRPACRGEVGQALRAAGVSPGKSVFFVVFYEIFLRISAQRPHPCRKRVHFGEGQGRKRVCFSVFLTKFFSRD